MHEEPEQRVKRPRRQLGRLEAAVLAVVASADSPVTVAQVKAQLHGDPAYTTVMSTLARLADKGALTRSLHGRAYRYQLAAAPESLDEVVTARQMHRLMGRHGVRDAVLARFVAELDPKEEQLLLELLARTQDSPEESP